MQHLISPTPKDISQAIPDPLRNAMSGGFHLQVSESVWVFQSQGFAMKTIIAHCGEHIASETWLAKHKKSVVQIGEGLP